MRTQFPKWLPALFMMLVIFWFSEQPGSEMPTFAWADSVIKKGGHMLGYGLLALSYWRAFDFKEEKRWMAWLLAVLYAVTDEFHQSFVPLRQPSLWDVVLFDNFGALISLWLANYFRKENRAAPVRPIVEEAKR
jgi:VanZ family protein